MQSYCFLRYILLHLCTSLQELLALVCTHNYLGSYYLAEAKKDVCWNVADQASKFDNERYNWSYSGKYIIWKKYN